MKKGLLKLALALLAIAAFLAFGFFLENAVGIPFFTTYRFACAIACLHFMATVAADYPGQRWPWVAVVTAAISNALLFLTPVFDRSASRGEIMIFALPDATIFLMFAAINRPTVTEHERAVRQQLILGAILAAALSALILAATFIPDKEAAKPTLSTAPKAT